MALSRVKTWTAEELTSADLNAEFDNILSNATSLISPLTGNLAFGGYRATGLSAGSVGNPSLQPTGDTDTGIYFGTDSVLFSCGGTNQGSFAKVGVAGSDMSGLTLNPTLVEAASGAHAILCSLRVNAPTITPGAATVTNAATLYVSAATGATVTGSDWALWVDDGTVQFDSNLNVGGALDVTGAMTGSTIDITSTIEADGLATFNAASLISSTVAATIPLKINHSPSGTISSKILEVMEKGVARFSFIADEVTDGSPLDLDDFDNSTGLGRFIYLGRNSNAGTPAPGHLKFTDKAGTARYLWFTSGGVPRYDTSAPTNTDTGGTSLAPQTIKQAVVGTAMTGPPANTDGFYPLSGAQSPTAAVTNVQSVVPFAGTLRNLYVASVSAGTVVTVMKNGSATSITANTTGSDLVNTVAVVAGDVVGIKLRSTADLGAVITHWGIELTIE